MASRLCWLLIGLGALGIIVGMGVAAPPPVRFDFETGDLQGWRLVEGDLCAQPSASDDDRSGGNFGKQGGYFIGTYEGDCGDGATGELRSPIFTIGCRKLSLLVGGGQHADTFVALVRADDDRELFRATGANREAMSRVIWEVAPYLGQRVYLRVVDHNTGGWGHINVDDIRELTADDERALAREQAAREQQRRERLRRFERSVHAPSKRTVYEGAALADVAFPLGGIAAGTISLAGDGRLREWQIFNRPNSQCVVPDSFFLLWARKRGSPAVSRALQTSPLGDMPGVTALRFLGEYPIAQVEYLDDSLPIRFRLEAFSPMIPLDPTDSALPAVVFNFKARNDTRQPVEVSLLGSLQNAVGYDGLSRIEGVACDGYGGNRNDYGVRREASVIEMRGGPPADAKTAGSMALATTAKITSACPQWADLSDWWNDFADDGRLTGTWTPGGSPDGRTWNGALTASATLRPGEERTVTFIVTWYFPNRYADYQAHLAKYRLGNMYTNWFADATGVADYVAANLDRLSAQTRLFHDTFYDSTLPYWLLDCVSSQISTLAVPTTLWIEEGAFCGFEGAGIGAGCCPMNCTHVWNYEQTLAHLWPSIERNMRETDLIVQQDPDKGFIHHRTVLPLTLPRASGPFADGHLSTISKTYREYLQSSDASWLDSVWPHVKRAMDWAVAEYDPDGNGVIEGAQPNTYDCDVYGPNTFIGSQWLTALRAAEEMARIEGDEASAARYRERYQRGRAAMDRDLWNGEYYIQKYDASRILKTQYGIGCLSDQVLGEWWAHLLGLGYVLPRDHVRGALESVFRYNWRTDFVGFVQRPRVFAGDHDMGLLNCSWPHGGRPAEPILYADEVWTGVEYQVAASMIWEGLTDRGLEIVKAARDRYNGVARPPFKRNPWDEIECGEHYARAMSSWSLLLAAQGCFYDGPRGIIGFSPSLTPSHHRSFFTAAQGWGTFSQSRRRRHQEDTLHLAYGRLELREIRLSVPGEARSGDCRAAITLRGIARPASYRIEDDTLVVVPQRPAVLRAGDALRMVIEW
jgi:non-lysosomal glucosylceramidase